MEELTEKEKEETLHTKAKQWRKIQNNGRKSRRARTDVMIARRRLEKVSRHYNKLTERHARESNDIEILAKALKKEERDVQRLENLGIRSLFSRILGDKEKQLEKERQEYLQVALKYNELTKSLELIEYEMDLLERKLDDKPEVEQRYEKLIERREREILEEGSGAASSLLKISRALDEKQVLLRDIREAIDAGQEAYRLSQRLEKQLKEARDWGQWDMYGSSGKGWLKHRAIDRARDYLHKVRHALIKFENELRDVYPNAHIDVNVRVERIDSFFDIFFDNLISDWVVQQRIMNALQHATRTKRQVSQALRDLEKEIPSVENEIEDLMKQRERTIVMG